MVTLTLEFTHVHSYRNSHHVDRCTKQIAPNIYVCLYQFIEVKSWLSIFYDGL